MRRAQMKMEKKTIAQVYEDLGLELLDPTPREEKNGVVSYEDPQSGRLYTFNPKSGAYTATTMRLGTQYSLNRRNGWGEIERVYGVPSQMKLALFTVLSSR